MSANNYVVCPACRAKAFKERERSVEHAKAQYGKLSPEDFMNAMALAQKPIQLGSSLREDWEIGMDDDGEFGINYSASCSRCSFKFEFSHEEQATL